MRPRDDSHLDANACSQTDVAVETPRLDPWSTIPVAIRRIRRETSHVLTYDLEILDSQIAEHYAFEPGQFNMLYVPGVGEAAISIAGVTQEGWISHSIQTVGNVTQAIESGGVGMHFGLRGPFGVGWPVKDVFDSQQKKTVVIVAGGVGLAPLKAMTELVISREREVASSHLLLGARTPEDLLYPSARDDWLANGIDVQATVDRPTETWHGHVGVVTLLLERLPIPDPESTVVMTCGPEVMMRYVAQTAIQRGIPRSSIWVTLERNMNCAIGLCGHCQLGPNFLCKDGPVFRYEVVENWIRIRDL
jgi:NAD(P)H-flavin reductase